MYKIVVNSDTLGKITPEQSQLIMTEYGEDGVVRLKADKIIECETVNLVNTPDGPHIFFRALEALGPKERKALFGFSGHFDIEEGDHPDPTDTPFSLTEDRKREAAKIVEKTPARLLELPSAAKDLGPMIRIPGLGQKRLYAPVYVDGKPTRFNWAEVTKGGNRIPISESVTEAILGIAKTMDLIRDVAGQPIIVTSWYRDPATNRKVGGATRSRHLVGDAVDFFFREGNLIEFFYELKRDRRFNQGGLAIGGRRTDSNGEPDGSFIHIDNRGYISRWLYRGGPAGVNIH